MEDYIELSESDLSEIVTLARTIGDTLLPNQVDQASLCADLVEKVEFIMGKRKFPDPDDVTAKRPVVFVPSVIVYDLYGDGNNGEKVEKLSKKVQHWIIKEGMKKRGSRKAWTDVYPVRAYPSADWAGVVFVKVF